MKCVYCGAEIRQGQIFCPTCGKEVQLVSAQSVLEDDYLDGFLNDGRRKKGKGRLWGVVEENSADAISSKQQKKLVAVSLCVMFFVLAVVGFLAWFLVYSTHSNSLSYQLEQGARAAGEGDTLDAISHYERALKLSRNNVEARVALGSLYLSLKDYGSAQTMFQEAINLDGRNVEAYRGLFQVFEQQKQYDRIPEAGASITDPELIGELSDYLIEKPEFSVPGGSYEEELSITLSSKDGNAIYYTTDGTDPVQYGTVYSEPVRFASEGSFRLSAVCVNSKGVYSARAQEEYKLVLKAPDKPSVSPQGGDFGAVTYISVLVPENCSAYYTWDGTDPDTSSRKYTAPFTIPSGAHVLSVVLVDERTGKFSEIYRNSYTFYER